MAQFDFGTMDPNTVSGTTLATDLNSWRDAMNTCHRGTTRPSYAVAGLIWQDTSVSPNIMKRWDGTNDVIIGYMDETNHIWMPNIGGGVVNISASATTDLGSVAGSHVVVNGTATITSFGSTMQPGQMKTLVFSGGATLVHNDPQLNLPTSANITVSYSDRMLVLCISIGNYYVVNYAAAGAITGELSGVVKQYAGLTAPAGYLFADGSAQSRTTYASLFAAITKQTTGTTVSTNATITSVVSTTGIAVGMPISGPGIQAGALVKSFVANTSITMTLAATASASGVAIVIAPHGVGDGSTTFNLPNLAGRSTIGRDDMSGAAQNIAQYSTTMTTTNGSATATITGANTGLCQYMFVSSPNVPPNTYIVTIVGNTVTLSSGTGVTAGTSVATRFSIVQDAQRLGATGGEISHILDLTQMPSHGHNATVSETAHTHTINGASGYVWADGPYGGGQSGGGSYGHTGFNQLTNVSNTTNLTVGNSPTGGGTPHGNTSPSVIMNFIVKT